MPHRVDLILRTKHSFGIGQRCGEHKQSLAHFLLARLIPLRRFKAAAARLCDLDCVLKCVDLFYVFRIVWINECADTHHDITSAYLLLREGMVPRSVENQWSILILIDDDHGHESLACIRHGDCHWSGIEVEYRGGIQRIAVGADHGLLVDGHDPAPVIELAEAAIFYGPAKIHVGLSAGEVVWGDGHVDFC